MEVIMEKKAITKRRMLEEALGRIEQIRCHLEAYGAALSFLRNRDRDIDRDPHFKQQHSAVYSALMRAELDEWRNLVVWGIVADDLDRDRIKAAAHERFLGERKSVCQWLFNGEQPSAWLASEEADFREMAREAFKPKGGSE